MSYIFWVHSVSPKQSFAWTNFYSSSIAGEGIQNGSNRRWVYSFDQSWIELTIVVTRWLKPCFIHFAYPFGHFQDPIADKVFVFYTLFRKIIRKVGIIFGIICEWHLERSDKMSKCVHGPNFMPINPEAIVQCTRCGEFTKRKDKSIEWYRARGRTFFIHKLGTCPKWGRSW